MQRRKFIEVMVLVLVPLFAFPSVLASTLSQTRQNFQTVYANKGLKKAFFNFLKNVFNLFPEDEFHELISKVAQEKEGDKAIYLEGQSRLDDIAPFLGVLTYQLPSLFKQKDEMARQTSELLGAGTSYDGYLEIGSLGRYLDYLEEVCTITGNRYYANGKKPGYSITDMIDRGQIAIGADFIPLADYQTQYSKIIDSESLDLVTVYIGFHHCPLDLRIPFISSIRDTMRMGGKLVLRDHDCHSEDQMTLVALAHDVFNMGTHESWEYNEREIRNFYTLDFIIEFVEKIGFRFEKRTLFQEGDPTKNALMLFTKVDLTV